MERLDVISAGDLRLGYMRCIRTASKGEGQMNPKDPAVRKALAAVLSLRRHQNCGACGVTDALEFVVRDRLWKVHCRAADVLCMACFLARLGRPLGADDLEDVPCNEIWRAALAELQRPTPACAVGYLTADLFAGGLDGLHNDARDWLIDQASCAVKALRTASK